MAIVVSSAYKGLKLLQLRSCLRRQKKTEDSDQASKMKIGRPKGLPTKAKTFTLPLELNQRLRRFAFEHECKEVDVVRAALESYLNEHEK